MHSHLYFKGETEGKSIFPSLNADETPLWTTEIISTEGLKLYFLRTWLIYHEGEVFRPLRAACGWCWERRGVGHLLKQEVSSWVISVSISDYHSLFHELWPQSSREASTNLWVPIPQIVGVLAQHNEFVASAWSWHTMKWEDNGIDL